MSIQFSFFLLIECYSVPSGVLPKYFNSEWSVARFHLHEGTQYTVAFGVQKNTVVNSWHECKVWYEEMTKNL